MNVKGLMKLLLVSVFVLSSLIFAPGLNASAKAAPAKPKIEVKSLKKVKYDRAISTKTTTYLYYQVRTEGKKTYYKYLRVEGIVERLDGRTLINNLNLQMKYIGVKAGILEVDIKDPTTKFTVYAPSKWVESPPSTTKKKTYLLAYDYKLDLQRSKSKWSSYASDTFYY
ncbi:hypothetical protein C2I27_03375 [Priestia megaterium]|uniref:hypothetical protein n=1 Tax=Priestia megaterium TaxID=1404 RepID=UPI000D524EF0|nr:hypothetical protein [Priestia megaterium]PVC74939.1 hypothetical protein C2I27_03375 [Priestia megaterium]